MKICSCLIGAHCEHMQLPPKSLMSRLISSMLNYAVYLYKATHSTFTTNPPFYIVLLLPSRHVAQQWATSFLIFLRTAPYFGGAYIRGDRARGPSGQCVEVNERHDRPVGRVDSIVGSWRRAITRRVLVYSLLYEHIGDVQVERRAREVALAFTPNKVNPLTLAGWRRTRQDDVIGKHVHTQRRNHSILAGL